MAETWEQFGAPNVSMMGMLSNLVKRNTIIIPNPGAPTNGTSGTAVGKAGPGALLLDYTNGQAYINTGTLASPTWSKLADAAGDISLARGFILVGNASGVAVATDFNDSGKFGVGDGTDYASVAMSGDATLASTGAVTIGAVVNGARVATVSNVNTSGGVPVVFRITATNLTGDVDVVMAQKVRIYDALIINTTGAGGAGDTIIVKNGANAISDTMDGNKADKTVTRALTIDDAFWDIAAAGTLRITGASAINCEVVVYGMLVP